MSSDRNSRLVYSTGGEAVAAAKPRADPGPRPSGGVRLRLDRRASGRLVTTISGLPGSSDALARLLKDLKTRCGAGGTVKDGLLELQGDQREKVGALLRERGIASKRAGG